MVSIGDLAGPEGFRDRSYTHHIQLSHWKYGGARAHSTQSGADYLPPRQWHQTPASPCCLNARYAVFNARYLQPFSDSLGGFFSRRKKIVDLVLSLVLAVLWRVWMGAARQISLAVAFCCSARSWNKMRSLVHTLPLANHGPCGDCFGSVQCALARLQIPQFEPLSPNLRRESGAFHAIHF